MVPDGLKSHMRRSRPHVDAAEAFRPQTPCCELKPDGSGVSDSGMKAIT